MSIVCRWACTCTPHFSFSFDPDGGLNREPLLRHARESMDISLAPASDTAARFLRRRLDHQHRWEVTLRQRSWKAFSSCAPTGTARR
jgi:hypothetical protein